MNRILEFNLEIFVHAGKSINMTVRLKEKRVSQAQETMEAIMAVAAKGGNKEDDKAHAKVQMELGVLTSASTNMLSSTAALANALSE